SAGLAQANQLATALVTRDLQAIWTSPLQRARTTAEIVADAMRLVPTVLPDLVASDRGSWEGLAIGDIAQQAPSLHAEFIAGFPTVAFPGGESLVSQRLRTERALTTIAAEPLPALVVAHAGTIRAVLALGGGPLPAESVLPHGQIAASISLPNAPCRC